MRKGFTLVELIIVIIIVGILASVGISQYNSVIEKGRAAEARMVLGNLRSAEIAEMNENGLYVAVGSLSVGAPAVCTSTHYFMYACVAGAATVPGAGTCTATRCLAGGKPPQSTVGAYTKTLNIAGTWGPVGSPY